MGYLLKVHIKCNDEVKTHVVAASEQLDKIASLKRALDTGLANGKFRADRDYCTKMIQDNKEDPAGILRDNIKGSKKKKEQKELEEEAVAQVEEKDVRVQQIDIPDDVDLVFTAIEEVDII